MVAHSSADESLTAIADETRTLYHNGDDAQGLMHVPTETLLDLVGEIGDDPGSGWVVAGISDGTKDHTLVRKCGISSGNTDWTSSAGTSSEDSEWIVYDQNTWTYAGSHDLECPVINGCMDSWACNYDSDATIDNGECEYLNDPIVSMTDYEWVLGFENGCYGEPTELSGNFILTF